MAVCTYCNRQFKVPPDVTLTAADAAAKLEGEFAQHKCERTDESQNAARIVRETTENK